MTTPHTPPRHAPGLPTASLPPAPATRNNTPTPVREPRKRASLLDRLPVAAIGVPLFALWWAMGGRYTIDGGPLVLNTILAFFRQPARVPLISGGVVYLYLCWLPILISIIERRNRPRKGLAWHSATVVALVVWAVVSLYDMSSTYLAVTNPPEDAWLLAKQVAAVKPLAAIWTAATTFLPEIGLVALVRYAVKG